MKLWHKSVFDVDVHVHDTHTAATGGNSSRRVRRVETGARTDVNLRQTPDARRPTLARRDSETMGGAEKTDVKRESGEI